jgi:hypothetical protein
MGQGYLVIILGSQPTTDDTKEIIRTWVDPHSYGNGYKLLEHSYINNNFVNVIEYLISPLGIFYKSRIVWAGDYADDEAEQNKNLNTISQEDINSGKGSHQASQDMSAYTYIVNHTTRQYVVKTEGIHPLPILTAEGNGRGGGDYYGTSMELVGTWARHILSVEKTIPLNYTELVCNFSQ